MQASREFDRNTYQRQRVASWFGIVDRDDNLVERGTKESVESSRALAVDLCNVAASLHETNRLDHAMDIYDESLRAMMLALKSKSCPKNFFPFGGIGKSEEREAQQHTERWRAKLSWGRSVVHFESSSNHEGEDTRMPVLDLYQHREVDTSDDPSTVSKGRCRSKCSRNAFTSPIQVELHLFCQEKEGNLNSTVGSATLLYNMGLIHHQKGASETDMSTEQHQHFGRAMQLLQMALQTLLDGGETVTTPSEETSVLLASILNNMGQIHSRNGRDREAIDAFQSALELMKCLMEPTEQQTSETATVEDSFPGGSAASVQSGKRVCHNYRHTSVPCKDDSDVVDADGRNSSSARRQDVAKKLAIVALNELGRLHFRRNEIDNAMVATRDALLLRRAVLGDEHLDVAVSLYNLGFIFHMMDYAEQARDHFLEFARMITSKKSPYAEDERCKYVVSALTQVLLIDCGRGRYDEELKMYLQSLQYRRETFGWTHPDVAESLNAVGSRLFQRDEYGMAIAFFTECLRVERATLTAHHYRISVTLNNIGQTLHQAGEHVKAKEAFEAALNVRLEEPSVQEELRLRQRQQQIYNHPVYAQVLYNIGSVLSETDRHEDAMTSLKLSVKLALSLGNQSTDHGCNDHIAKTLHDAGTMLANEYGQLSLAMHALSGALRLRVQTHGTQHATVAECLKTMGRILRDEGRFDEAAESFAEALRIERLVLDPRSPELASTLSAMGHIHDLREESSEALRYFHEALGIMRQSTSTDVNSSDVSVSILLNAIGTIHHERGDSTQALMAFAEARSAGGSGREGGEGGTLIDFELITRDAYPPCAGAA